MSAIEPIDRVKFFAAVRAAPFPGTLSQAQVNGMVFILDRWESDYADEDLRWLAYCLATVFHEVDAKMVPISEYGLGAGRPYGVPDPVTHQTYFGRGDVQLTWKANYEKFAAILGIDLVHKPALALVPTYAAAIMFTGMMKGLFTGVGLPKYFNATAEDPVNARRIINGTDQAEKIAGYYRAFKAALVHEEPVAPEVADPVPQDVVAEYTPVPASGGSV